MTYRRIGPRLGDQRPVGGADAGDRAGDADQLVRQLDDGPDPREQGLDGLRLRVGTRANAITPLRTATGTLGSTRKTDAFG